MTTPLMDRIKAAEQRNNLRPLRVAEPVQFVPAWRRRLQGSEADRFLARQDTTNSIYSDGCGPDGRAA